MVAKGRFGLSWYQLSPLFVVALTGGVIRAYDGGMGREFSREGIEMRIYHENARRGRGPDKLRFF